MNNSSDWKYYSDLKKSLKESAETMKELKEIDNKFMYEDYYDNFGPWNVKEAQEIIEKGREQRRKDIALMEELEKNKKERTKWMTTEQELLQLERFSHNPKEILKLTDEIYNPKQNPPLELPSDYLLDEIDEFDEDPEIPENQEILKGLQGKLTMTEDLRTGADIFDCIKTLGRLLECEDTEILRKLDAFIKNYDAKKVDIKFGNLLSSLTIDDKKAIITFMNNRKISDCIFES